MRARVEALLSRNASGPEAAILRAHLAILGDVTLHREIAQRIDYGVLRGAGDGGSGRTLQRFAAARGERLYPRARGGCAGVVRRIARGDLRRRFSTCFDRVARTFHPRRRDAGAAPITGAGPPVAEGIVLESAGATSHAVILARSMGIPTVVGWPTPLERLRPARRRSWTAIADWCSLNAPPR